MCLACRSKHHACLVAEERDDNLEGERGMENGRRSARTDGRQAREAIADDPERGVTMSDHPERDNGRRSREKGGQS